MGRRESKKEAGVAAVWLSGHGSLDDRVGPEEELVHDRLDRPGRREIGIGRIAAVYGSQMLLVICHQLGFSLLNDLVSARPWVGVVIRARVGSDPTILPILRVILSPLSCAIVQICAF